MAFQNQLNLSAKSTFLRSIFPQSPMVRFPASSVFPLGALFSSSLEMTLWGKCADVAMPACVLRITCAGRIYSGPMVRFPALYFRAQTIRGDRARCQAPLVTSRPGQRLWKCWARLERVQNGPDCATISCAVCFLVKAAAVIF